MRIALLAFVVLAAACGGGDAATEPKPPAPQLSADALTYLTEALDTMQRRSVNRDLIEWAEFRRDVVRRAGAAQTFRDTYPAIRYATDGLGDNHSYFVEPENVTAARAPAPPRFPPRGELVRERLGYLRVPGFAGSGAEEFAAELQGLVARLDSAGACGWIVDLRAETGGNMWPMLLGLGPLVGTGVVGYFVRPDSVWTAWHHSPGAVGIDGAPTGFRIPGAYTLRRPDPPVAVLTGNGTVSSGEAIATAFRARPNTRSFGEPTAGLSTGIAGFRLRDGAQLGLAVSVFADRARHRYGGRIPPDHPVEGAMRDDPISADPAVGAAADWLLARGDCQTTG